MLNPNLIKPELDDRNENAAPTLGTLMAARFSTPNPDQHNLTVYGADREFFKSHPDRRLYLRDAFPGEWDVFTTTFEFEQRLSFTVLVAQLYEGFH